MDWLHTRPCIALYQIFGSLVHVHSESDQLENKLEAAHFRDLTGASLKESDLTAIPLCKRVHDMYDGRTLRGSYFEGWTRDEKKTWHRKMQAAVRSRYIGESR